MKINMPSSKRLRVLYIIICILIVILAATIIVTEIRIADKKKKSAGKHNGAVGYAYNADGELGYIDENDNFVAVPDNAIVLGESILQQNLVKTIFERKAAAEKEILEVIENSDSGVQMEGMGNSSKTDSSVLSGKDKNAGAAVVDGEIVNPDDIYLSAEYNDNRIKYLEYLGFTRINQGSASIAGDGTETDPDNAEPGDSENTDGTDTETDTENDTEPEDEVTDDPLEEVPEPVTYLSVYTAGVDDPSVSSIQERLMQLGFMENSEPTQHYGPITMEAVKLFQRQNDLKQDGIIGEQTIAMLFDDNAKTYLLKSGMSGNDIREVQKRLYELGYLANLNNISGTYDDGTVTAVKSLQSNNGLSADGKIGIVTNELLYSENVRANIISSGTKSDIVLECQKKLKQLGYLTTEPDGYYGEDTTAAVRQFQSRNDCIVDGYLGPSTRAVLNSSTAKPNGLVIGDRNDNVKRVQALLIKYGYLNAGNDTGYFGELTEAAVKAFQKNNGLTADGNVGQKTMNILSGDSVVKAGEKSGGGKTGDDKKNDKSDDKTGDTGEDKNEQEGQTMSGSIDNLISIAKTKIGCKYVYGSKGPNTFDCSGFVYWCLKQVGVNQSYITSYGWRTVGKYKKITSFDSIKKGDIVVVYGHVGIAAGNGEVIDASSSAGEIVYRTMGDWWKNKFVCAWRIFD